MAKIKTLKKETVKRIEELLKKHDFNIEDMIASEKYRSLYKNYMNSVEKDNIDLIINSICKGFSFDEIGLLIKNLETPETFKPDKSVKSNSKKATDKKSVIEEETEKIFMISQQKVVETGPVDVIIEPVTDVETIDAMELLESDGEGDENNPETTEDHESIFMCSDGGKVVDVDVNGEVLEDKTNESITESTKNEVLEAVENVIDNTASNLSKEAKNVVNQVSGFLSDLWHRSALGVFCDVMTAKTVSDKSEVAKKASA